MKITKLNKLLIQQVLYFQIRSSPMKFSIGVKTGTELNTELYTSYLHGKIIHALIHLNSILIRL